MLAVAAVAVVLFGAMSPLSAAEPLTPSAVTMTATPDTLLVQGDDVTVAGSGATPNSFVGIAQCLAGATGLESCAGFGGGTSTSGSGNFATVFTPRRILTIAGVAHDCADVATCELAAIAFDENPTIVASAGIQFDPSVPPPPPPTLTGSPTTGLVQGDVVNLVGSDYPPNGGLGVVQCLSSAPTSGGTGEGCDLSTLQSAQTDGGGGFTHSFTPLRIIVTGDGASHDCALEACVIGAGTPVDGEGARVDIQFDANVPPPPPPTITVTPAQDLQDGQTVTVTGVGFQPNISVNLVQCGNPIPNSGSNCDLGNLVGGVQVAADGSFSGQITVHRSFRSPDGDIDCSGTDRCAIGAGNSPGRGDNTPINFAAATTGGGGGTTARAVSTNPSYAG